MKRSFQNIRSHSPKRKILETKEWMKKKKVKRVKRSRSVYKNLRAIIIENQQENEKTRLWNRLKAMKFVERKTIFLNFTKIAKAEEVEEQELGIIVHVRRQCVRSWEMMKSTVDINFHLERKICIQVEAQLLGNKEQSQILILSIKVT